MGKKLAKNRRLKEIVAEELYRWDTKRESNPIPFDDIPFYGRLRYLENADKFFGVLKTIRKKAVKEGLIKEK